ncbi:MAG: hypothetical protein SVO01_12290 [Thermotogota bacterium]|nr:hypothetical protein [Thermotogota bacterium]
MDLTQKNKECIDSMCHDRLLFGWRNILVGNVLALFVKIATVVENINLLIMMKLMKFLKKQIDNYL